MNIQIESKNIYLHIAFENIRDLLHLYHKTSLDEGIKNKIVFIDNHSGENHICIIDVSSFDSLREIFRCVNKKNQATKFIFIGDDGIYSKVLSTLIYVDGASCIRDILECLFMHGVDYDSVIFSIRRFLDLSYLPHHDLITIYGLVVCERLTDSVEFSGNQSKLFYQRINKLTKILNLRCGYHTHFFYRREFSVEYVKSILLRR